MKPNQSFIVYILSGALALALLALILPGDRVQSAWGGVTVHSALAADASPSSCDTQRTISVIGSALVHIVPDRALIQLGLQSNGLTASDVEQNNTAAIQRITGSLNALGIESRDISTNDYLIEPVYDDYTSLFIKGYRIQNVIAITLRDFTQVSVNQALATALENGANQVIGVEFYTSDLRKYRDQARDLAMKAAAEKAQAMASAVGALTDCVLSIHENNWSYINSWGYGQAQNINAQNVIQNAYPASSETNGMPGDDGPVSPGQISVRAEASVTFSLK